jgi:hypothetical protein
LRPVFGDDPIGVEVKLAVMLRFQMAVEAEQFLPFDNRQSRVQGVEIGNLDVAVAPTDCSSSDVLHNLRVCALTGCI